MSDPILRVVIGENPPPRLDKALAEVVPEDASLSRSSLGKLIEAGAVAREGGGVVTVLKTKTQVGEVFLITVPEAVDIEAQPEAIPLDVIFEDDDLIVINKPAGMVVHPAPGSETGTLVNALLAHCADSLSGIGGGLCTGSTRIRRVCWWWRKATARITGWRRSSLTIRSSGIIWRFVMECRRVQIQGWRGFQAWRLKAAT